MNASPRTVAASLTNMAPRVPPEVAAALVYQHYGLIVMVERMQGERDDNFRLTTSDGERYALKILHPAEAPAVTSAQTEVLQHIARTERGLPVATVVPALDGAVTQRLGGDGPEAGRAMRLTSFCTGVPFRERVASYTARVDFGVQLARTARALCDFQPTAHGNPCLPWDLARATDIRPLVDYVGRAQRRAFLREFLDHFDVNVRPQLRRLRVQWVHNDFNGDNILVGPDDHVSGILDFGDMAETQLVNDVAVAATHVARNDQRLMTTVADLVRGYDSVTPLTAGERRLLPELMITRMVIRVVLNEWRAWQFPENATYTLRYVARTWGQLDLMRSRPAAEWVYELDAATCRGGTR